MNEDIGNRLNSLLSDPQALGRIMSMVSGLMGSPQGSSPPDLSMSEHAYSPPSRDIPMPEPPPSNELRGQAEPTFSGAGLPPLELSAFGNDRRCELLSALKPYMKSERAGKIDLMIRVLRLSALMKSSGIGHIDR